MFVQAEAGVGSGSTIVALPASAISYAPFGDSVFVVTDLKNPAGRATAGCAQQFVKLGPARGDQIAVTSGVKPGDEVVTSGLFKLRNGAAVVINNKVKPTNRPSRSRRTADEVHRSVRQAAGAGDRRQPGDPDRRLQSIRALSVRQYPRSDIASSRRRPAYVGANADLVRGFITTPLERVIASADGIDYMESSSAQGAQHDHRAPEAELRHQRGADADPGQGRAGAQRSAARGGGADHRPADADNQFAAIYLGFSSNDLDPNQITDYLTRRGQPKLSAILGRPAGRQSRRATFAMRIWLKPDQMAAPRHRAVEGAATRWPNNYLSALGRHQGSMVSSISSPTPTCDRRTSSGRCGEGKTTA
jgi:hypothetical protein